HRFSHNSPLRFFHPVPGYRARCQLSPEPVLPPKPVMADRAGRACGYDRMESPKAQMCDADHRRARRGLLYRQQQDTYVGRRGTVMTWTSDRAGVVLYTVLGMLIVLSSIYIPA